MDKARKNTRTMLILGSIILVLLLGLGAFNVVMGNYGYGAIELVLGAFMFKYVRDVRSKAGELTTDDVDQGIDDKE